MSNGKYVCQIDNSFNSWIDKYIYNIYIYIYKMSYFPEPFIQL